MKAPCVRMLPHYAAWFVLLTAIIVHQQARKQQVLAFQMTKNVVPMKKKHQLPRRSSSIIISSLFGRSSNGSRGLYRQGLQTQWRRDQIRKINQYDSRRNIESRKVCSRKMRLSGRMWLWSKSCYRWTNSQQRSWTRCCITSVRDKRNCRRIMMPTTPEGKEEELEDHNLKRYQKPTNLSTWFRMTPYIFVVLSLISLTTFCLPVEGFVPTGRNSFCLVRASNVHDNNKNQEKSYSVIPNNDFGMDLNMIRESNNNDNNNMINDWDSIGEGQLDSVGNDGTVAASSLDDLYWRVEKLRLEEQNTKRFLKAKPRFLPYDECRKWVQAFGRRWTTEQEWEDWIAMGEKKNPYIPSRPDEYYKSLGKWISWEHFLLPSSNSSSDKDTST